MQLKNLPYKSEIRFKQEVLDTLLTYKQGHNGTETGGVLLGQVYTDGEIIVCRCSDPCIAGKADKKGFSRSSKTANKIINDAFVGSNGTILYVGEWHTHPEPYPRPSTTDKTSIEEIYRTANINNSNLIYVIVGEIDIFCGVYDGKTHYRVPLSIR